MNDRELIQKFLESGYVITNPRKFYREIRTMSLETLLNELNSNNDRAFVSRDYSEIENDVLAFIREIRGIVVNDSEYISSNDGQEEFIRLLRDFDNKYILTSQANEKRTDIGNQIRNARVELDDINSELATNLNELNNIRTRRGSLRRDLENLNSSDISDVERTQRTFEIISEIDKLANDIPQMEGAVNSLRSRSENKESEIRELQKSLEGVKDVEIPIFDSSMRDSLISDANRISNFVVTELSLSADTKANVRKLTSDFVAKQAMQLAGSDRAHINLRELYDRFGIAKTNEYKKDEGTLEVHEVVKEESNVEFIAPTSQEVINVSEESDKEPLIEEVTSVNETALNEEANSDSEFSLESILNEFLASFEKKDDRFKEELEILLQGHSDLWKKSYLASAIKKSRDNNLIHEEELYVDYITRNGYSLPDILATSDKYWLDNVDEEVNEKNSKTVVFTGKINNVPVNAIAFNGLKVGEEYIVEYEDDINYKLKGFDSSFIKDAFMPVELWKAVSIFNSSEEAAEPKLEPISTGESISDNNEESKNIPSMWEVGNEVVFFLHETLSDDEKEYFDINYIKRGLKIGHKYKISKVNDNDSINLEGIEGNFPKMGFITIQEYNDYMKIVNRGSVALTPKDNDKAGKRNESQGDFVIYNGKDTDELKNGIVYIRKFAIGKKAVFEDQYGNEITINYYDKNNFEIFNPTKEKEYKDASVKDLPEITLVEDIEELTKKGGKLTTLGLVGILCGTGLGIASSIVAAVPLLGVGALSTVVGIISQTKFARSFKATRTYKKLDDELSGIYYDLENNSDLSPEDKEDILKLKDSLETSLHEISEYSNKQGISYKLM